MWDSPRIDRWNARLRVQAGQSVRWNVLPLYEGMRSARLFVLSTPKCGRTWLRTFLTAYDARRRGVSPGHRLAPTERALGVVFAHDRWEHTVAPWSALLLGRCLVAPAARPDARIVILARDPRDALVSSYFEFSRRRRWYGGSLDDMVLHPIFGIGRTVDVMNEWARQWRGSERATLLRYEDLMNAPREGFRRFLEFGLGDTNERALDEAAAFASFPHMQELEAAGHFEDDALRGAVPSDPDSFKVRRGKVGGYVDTLTGTALARANQELARLDPWFGYGERRPPAAGRREP